MEQNGYETNQFLLTSIFAADIVWSVLTRINIVANAAIKNIKLKFAVLTLYSQETVFQEIFL